MAFREDRDAAVAAAAEAAAKHEAEALTRLAELERRLDAKAADVAALELAATAAAERESALRAELDDERTALEADLRAAKAEAMRSASDAYDATARAETALVALEAAQERENELRALLDPATNPRATRGGGVAEGTPVPADPKNTPAEGASTSSASDAPPPPSVAETLAAALEAAGLREGQLRQQFEDRSRARRRRAAAGDAAASTPTSGPS